MRLKRLELHGFKSFAKKSEFIFGSQITGIVGPNGSGKSNVVESLRFVLGEQSMKSMRGKSGTDLIWNGSKEIPKMSRAMVTVTFDNADRIFHFYNDENKKVAVDFDEIVISREIFSDGTSIYKLNGTEVRLRDIQELVSSVNIGSSSHHIVSQGEADKYLNANPRDRKEMVEEALGLKHYHYRINEATRKLEKAKENLRESDIVRREIAPHLKFLRKQVKKHEEAKEIRDLLLERYSAYLVVEGRAVGLEKESLETKVQKLEAEKNILDTKLKENKELLSAEDRKLDESEITKIELEINKLVKERNEISHNIGKLEGMLQMLAPSTKSGDDEEPNISIPIKRVKLFGGSIIKSIDEILFNEDIEMAKLREKLENIKINVNRFLTEENPSVENNSKGDIGNRAKLEKELKESLNEIERLLAKEESFKTEIKKLRDQNQNKHSRAREIERVIFETERARDGINTELSQIAYRLEELRGRGARLLEEETEAFTLLGKHIVEEKMKEIANNSIRIDDLEKERREIERMKIRLEDVGTGSGAEINSEYKELAERDEFLEREMKDLEESIASTESMVRELNTELEKKFLAGLDKVNREFQEFFSYIFGGGKAKINVIKIPVRKTAEDTEEEIEKDPEIGIDISVSVPRKTIKDTNMLSGGERSLTSIAILFALSSVEPPPFLVLDETDATLDEVNSRKYGEMLKKLAELSQLILVTHNRETMAASDTLYGVVFGRDDASQLLSVKLEEAVKIAK